MTTYATAHDPRAPHDERNDALGQLQQTYLPTPSDLIPRADLAPVIDFIADQYAQQDAAILRKAQAIDFMGRPRAKTGMQSVRLDPLQALAFGEYYERPSVLNTDALRAMVEQTPILNAVLLTRIRQVQRFCQVQEGGSGPGFMIAHVDPQHDITPPEQRAREALTRFLTHSGWESRPLHRARLRRDPFSTLIAKAVRESLTYDALAIETETQRGTGLLDGCYALDGSTIRLCPETGYRGDPDVFAVQVVTGQVVTTYTHDDLIYTPRNPRADVRLGGYGLGETELLVRVVTGFLNAMTHNSKGFDDNSFPRGFLSLFGTIDTNQQEAFKRHWHSMVHGPNNHWRMPVLFSQDPTGKAEFTRIDVAADEMHFAKWMTFLTSLICAIYGMSPAEINFDSFTGGNTSALAGSDTAQKLAASKDSGLRPLLSYLEGVCSDYLVGRFSDHYCFRWTGLDEDDAAQRLEIRKLVLTVNELRAEEGYAALPGPLGDAPINPSLIGPWMQIATGGGQTDDTSGADAREQDGATASADASQPGGPDAGAAGDPEAAAPDEATGGAAGGAGERLAKANQNHDDLGRFSRIFAPAPQPGETRGQSGGRMPLTAQQVPGLAQSIADHLMHIHPVTLPDRDGPDARKEALAAARKTSAWMRENGMAIHNAHSGALLELSLRGLKHAKVMSGDLRAAMLLYKLPSALARAVYVKSEQLDPRKQDHKNIVAYHKFAVPIVSQGGLALALLHVEEDRRGKFYYDAAITPEIKRLDGTSGASISCKEDRETCQRQAYVQHILTLLKVKPGLSEVHAFLCKAWGGTAGGAGERLAKADPYHDDDGRFARSPQVHYEKRQLHELYDFTLKHPLAAPDAMLVRLQASDLVAQLDKGPAVEASDGSIKVTGKQLSRQPGGTARGYGLVKFIWKHGERAGETAGYHVTRGDVLALPEVIRSTPTAIVSDATGHPVHWEWRRTRFDGKTAVYGASRFTSSDDRNHLVTLYIEQPGRVQKSGSNLGEGLFTPMPRIPACDLSIVQQAVEPLTIYYCPAQTEVKDAFLSKAIPTVDPLVWSIVA